MTNQEIKDIIEKDVSQLTPCERAYALAKKILAYKTIGNRRTLERDETDLERALRLTSKVSFLTTLEEKQMYAGALLAAIRWGNEIDRKNKLLQQTFVEMAGGEKPEERPETQEERRERIRQNFERSVALQKFFREFR